MKMASIAPFTSCSLIATNGTSGSARTGSAKRMPVESSPDAARAVVAIGTSKPAWASIFSCSAPPAATPPGTARPTALPAEWEQATSNQSLVPSAIRCSSQMATKLTPSRIRTTTNHAGVMSRSRGRASNVARRPGSTK